MKNDEAMQKGIKLVEKREFVEVAETGHAEQQEAQHMANVCLLSGKNPADLDQAIASLSAQVLVAEGEFRYRLERDLGEALRKKEDYSAAFYYNSQSREYFGYLIKDDEFSPGQLVKVRAGTATAAAKRQHRLLAEYGAGLGLYARILHSSAWANSAVVCRAFRGADLVLSRTVHFIYRRNNWRWYMKNCNSADLLGWLKLAKLEVLAKIQARQEVKGTLKW